MTGGCRFGDRDMTARDDRAALSAVRAVLGSAVPMPTPSASAMIRHIVLFSAKSPEHLPAVIEGLSLLARIPHARRLEVAPNAKSDRFANEVDVVVYGEFDDLAALEAYRAHPLYQEAVRRVRPLREIRVAADYDTADVAAAGPG